MSLWIPASTFVVGLYVGAHSGYQIITWAKAEIAKLHTKLDALIAKTVNTVHPRGK